MKVGRPSEEQIEQARREFFAYLRALPDRGHGLRKFLIQDAVNATGTSRDTLAKYLRHMEESGLITILRTRKDLGHRIRIL